MQKYPFVQQINVQVGRCCVRLGTWEAVVKTVMVPVFFQFCGLLTNTYLEVTSERWFYVEPILMQLHSDDG